MRALAVLTEELESRPGDADRVAALARHLRVVGRRAGALAGEWLVAAPGVKPARPARLTLRALAEAARALAAQRGMASWLFDVGVAASTESAEAIALLLPWPADSPAAAGRPPLVDWLARWTAAASQPAPLRAGAVAATIAHLDDAVARRWAVRAVCGQVRPAVDEWQWQRAWAQAFDIDAQAVAWCWHRQRERLLAEVPAVDVPRARDFKPLPDAPADLHEELLAAWRRADLHVEPRWNGVRVQIVRHGDAVAVWQRGGRLLNAHLPAAWLAPAQWPLDAAIEGVLLAWHEGRMVALDDARLARKPAAGPGPTLHLALTDWHAASEAFDQRRTRLAARWPVPDLAGGAAPSAIFTSPGLPAPAAAAGLASHANAARADGWSGLVLRHRVSTVAWAVRAAVHRVHAVLQYVPGDALAADPMAALALGFVECGFALWNRGALSEDEQRAAMTAAMSGEFLSPPAAEPGLAALRLLPLARLPIALPDDELLRLHAWLRAHAGSRFGGMHAVAPVLVFELGFTGVRPSRRHKIGATLVGARVLRWLHDAAPGGAQLADDLLPTN
jgi:DNA ligase-1